MLSSGDAEWSRVFYRYVDSDLVEDGDSLRLMEEKLFVEEVKDEVEKKLGSWIGSKKQNCLADLKVAVTVKNALKAYEKNKKDHEKSFFVF